MQEKEYLKIIFPTTGKEMTFEWVVSDVVPQLNPLIEQYNQWFEKHSDSLSSEFAEIKEGIELWLKDKYKISPTAKAFTQWFIANRLGTTVYKVDFKLDKITKELLPDVKLHISFPNIDNTYTPAIIEKDLLEFCYWRQQQLEELHNKVVFSLQEKQSLSHIKKIKNTNSIGCLRIEEMDTKPKEDLPYYRICPDCKGDLLNHSEVIEEIEEEVQEYKKKIERYKRLNTTKLYIKHLETEAENWNQLTKKQEEQFKTLYHGSQNSLARRPLIKINIWERFSLICKEELESQESGIIKDFKKQESSKDTTEIISFDWQGMASEVDNIYDRLIEGRLIDKNTDKANFKKVFSGLPLNDISPINWTGQKNLLAYLIDKLNDEGKILEEHFWSIAEHCFSNVSNLSQMKFNYTSLNKSEKPRGFSKIDKVLKELIK